MIQHPPDSVTAEEMLVLGEVAMSSLEQGEIPYGRGGAACAASTRVSLSETEDVLSEEVSSLLTRKETPSWMSSAHDASLCNTLTALTLSGVPVTHTTREDVVRSLRNIVTVTTASQGAEVEFTLRPLSYRPRVVDNVKMNA